MINYLKTRIKLWDIGLHSIYATKSKNSQVYAFEASKFFIQKNALLMFPINDIKEEVFIMIESKMILASLVVFLFDTNKMDIFHDK